MDAKQYYYKPMLWVVGAGVVTECTETAFAPDDIITRSETVTFLYRVYKK